KDCDRREEQHEKTAGIKIIGKGHNSAPGYSPDNHALQFVTVNGRAIRGMSVYDTPIDVCFWGIADIDGRVTCPLCVRDRHGQRSAATGTCHMVSDSFVTSKPCLSQ